MPKNHSKKSKKSSSDEDVEYNEPKKNISDNESESETDEDDINETKSPQTIMEDIIKRYPVKKKQCVCDKAKLDKMEYGILDDDVDIVACNAFKIYILNNNGYVNVTNLAKFFGKDANRWMKSIKENGVLNELVLDINMVKHYVETGINKQALYVNKEFNSEDVEVEGEFINWDGLYVHPKLISNFITWCRPFCDCDIIIRRMIDLAEYSRRKFNEKYDEEERLEALSKDNKDDKVETDKKDDKDENIDSDEVINNKDGIYDITQKFERMKTKYYAILKKTVKLYDKLEASSNKKI